MSNEVRGHQFPKWGPRGPFRIYSWTQASVTVLGFVVAALMLVAEMGGPALLLAGVLGALALRDPTGMPAWTRVGFGLRYLSLGWLGRRRGAATEGESPSWMAGIEISGYELPHGVVGLVKDRGRYLAAMRVSPTRDPWLQSRDDREVTADDWARVVTSLPTETIDRLQVLTVTRSGSGDDLLDDAATADGPGLEVLKEVASFLSEHVRQSETVLVIRLGLGAAKEASRQGGEEAVGRLLHSTLQHLGGQLPPENVSAEILAPADWLGLLHTMFSCNPEKADHLRMPAPSVVDERWSTVTVDGTIHRLMWLWQLPQRPMAAGFMAPLLTGPGNRVVSLLIAPADPERHQRSLDWAYRRAQSAVETAKASRHRKEAEMDSLDRQLRELNEGHIPVQVLMTVAVSDTTPEAVEDLTGRVRSNAVAGSCRIAHHAGRQLRALSWALPLCRGLDKGADQ